MNSKIVRSETLSSGSRDQRGDWPGREQEEITPKASKRHRKSATKNRRASKKDLTDASPPPELGDNLNA